MLYFSKIRIIVIVVLTIIFVYLTASNFFKFDDNLINKKINLGLDLQGGSYLLLEIDNKPVITQRLQNKLIYLRKALKNKKIKYQSLKLQNETINFKLSNKFRKYLVQKGSITINGVSLTIVKILKNGFQIAIIPQTLKLTNLIHLKVKDVVNVEFDILGKYMMSFVK